MRMRLYLALLLLVLLCGLTARAQTLPSNVAPGKWWKNSQIVKQLQLKESQVAQIEQIFMGHQDMLFRQRWSLKNENYS